MSTLYLAIFIFIVCCTMDILYIEWYRSQHEDREYSAAGYSMMIQVVALLGFLFAVKDPILVIPNILGHGIGSFLGTRWKKVRKKRNEKTSGSV